MRILAGSIGTIFLVNQTCDCGQCFAQPLGIFSSRQKAEIFVENKEDDPRYTGTYFNIIETKMDQEIEEPEIIEGTLAVELPALSA